MKTFLFSFLGLFAMSAQASRLVQVPVSEVEYACRSDKTVYWLDIDGKRAWVSAADNETMGVILGDIQVKTYRCRDTYQVTGKNSLGRQTAVYTINFSGCSGGKITGSVSISKENGEQILPISKVVCTKK